MKPIITILLMLIIGRSYAQEISGRILDEKKEPFVSVSMQVLQGGILKGGNYTDYDGNYLIKPLDPGYYDVLAIYNGYDSMLITGVVVTPGQRTTQNFVMQKHLQGEKQILMKPYKKPLVDVNKPATLILTQEDLPVIPIESVKDIAGGIPTVYIVDGIRVVASNTTGFSDVGVHEKACIPLINIDNPTCHILTRNQLDHVLSWYSVNDLVSLFPGVYRARRGDDVSIFSSRTNGNSYILDGLR